MNTILSVYVTATFSILSHLLLSICCPSFKRRIAIFTCCYHTESKIAVSPAKKAQIWKRANRHGKRSNSSHPSFPQIGKRWQDSSFYNCITRRDRTLDRLAALLTHALQKRFRVRKSERRILTPLSTSKTKRSRKQFSFDTHNDPYTVQ